MEQNVTFAAVGIELLEFAIKSYDKAIPENTPYKYNINLDHRFNISQKNMFVVASVEIFGGTEEVELCNAKISCIYNIDNLSDFVKEKKVELPEQFIVTVNSISLSTIRGVLFALFRGTHLHNLILPILDPKEFKSNK
ncbi:MAG: hypothetical protein PHU66_02000 [Bacteroidaceae bacterium]|nr:hypothetical protein [Bacteroidaceae bacterium]